MSLVGFHAWCFELVMIIIRGCQNGEVLFEEPSAEFDTLHDTQNLACLLCNYE